MTHFVRAAIIVAPAAAVVLGYVVSDKKPGEPSTPWDVKSWLPHPSPSPRFPLDIGPTSTPRWDSHHGITGGRLYNSEGWPLGTDPDLMPVIPDSGHGMTGLKLYPPGLWPTPTPPPPNSSHGITGGRPYNSEGWPLWAYPELTPAPRISRHGILDAKRYNPEEWPLRFLYPTPTPAATDIPSTPK